MKLQNNRLQHSLKLIIKQLIYIIVLLSGLSLQANPQRADFFDKLYRYDLKAANEALGTHLEATRDTLENDFLSINLLWWEGLTGNTQLNKSATFSNSIEQLLLKLQNKTQKTSHERFIEISTVAFKLRACALQSQYLALLNLMLEYDDELDYILKNELAPEFELIKGLYNTCMGHTRRTRFFLGKCFWFLPESNEQKGLQQLANTRKLKGSIQWEARYFSYKIHLELYKQPQIAEKYLDQLLSQFPENILYQIEKYRHFSDKNAFLVAKLRRKIRNSNFKTKRKQYLNSLL